MRKIFGDEVDYAPVRIVNKRSMTDEQQLLTLNAHAMTLGNTILIRKSNIPEKRLKALIAHEMTHVWQFQHHGWIYVVKSLLAFIQSGKAVYSYKIDGKHFDEYTVEQQAQIVQDYLLYSGNTNKEGSKKVLQGQGLFRSEQNLAH